MRAGRCPAYPDRDLNPIRESNANLYGDADPGVAHGDAVPFIEGPEGRIEGAEVFIQERPELRVTTGADGHFEFHDLEAGSEVTLVMDHPDYYPIQTATILLGPEGAVA